MLSTRIPEQRNIAGLEYGAHVSRPEQGWSGYYVRPAGTDLPMGIARLTPAADELLESDAEIVQAIADELASASTE